MANNDHDEQAAADTAFQKNRSDSRNETAKEIELVTKPSVARLLLPKEGDGFTIRSFERADIEHLAEIEFDLDVKRYLSLPVKEDEKTEWIQKFSISSATFAIDCNGKLAGRASLLSGEDNHERELAIIIDKPFWGKGLGRQVAGILISAAFEELPIVSIVANVHPENNPSIKLLQYFNFRQSGEKKVSESYQNGFLIYRLSKSDFSPHGANSAT